MENIQGVFLWSDKCKHVAFTSDSSVSKLAHAFLSHKSRNQKYLYLACRLLAIFLRSFVVFAKISCGDAVSRTPLTTPVGGDGFFSALEKRAFWENKKGPFSRF